MANDSRELAYGNRWLPYLALEK